MTPRVDGGEGDFEVLNWRYRIVALASPGRCSQRLALRPAVVRHMGASMRGVF
jgi:hypothetical protein